MTAGPFGAPQRPRSRAPLVFAAIFGLVLVLGVRAFVTRGSGSDDQGTGPVQPREGCVTFTLAASPEKSGLLQAIAADYQRADREVDGRCVDAIVTSKSSGGGMQALARGWDDRVDGPRPDVWSPASSSWAVLLRQQTTAQDKPDLVPGARASDLPSLAQTPLVFAMPRPMAQALGWPNKPIGFGDLLALSRDPAGWGKYGHPEWGRFRLGKTNPDFSTSGLNATIGAYFAATGVISDLTAANVNDPKTVEYVKGVEAAVVHYGDTTLTFLGNLQTADDAGRGLSYISAVTVEEKSVWDYNKGNPSGDPKTLGQHGPPQVPLVAVYPKEGTLVSDNPYIVLRAPWVDDAKRRAAEDFLAFAREDRQQRRFQEAAFRNFKGEAGGEITQANGLIPGGPARILTPPAPDVLELVRQSWHQLRKPARVLVLLDVSGSMGQERKLELAKTAAIRSLSQFAPTDDVGLWIFSTDRNGDIPYRELVPIAPIARNRATLTSKIQSLVADGGTALYASTRAAADFMERTVDPGRINAVLLLTDGKNEYPPDQDVEGLLRDLSNETEERTVRVFTIGYGSDADLPTLERIAKASRAAAYDASDPASIERVFTNVVSNF